MCYFAAPRTILDLSRGCCLIHPIFINHCTFFNVTQKPCKKVGSLGGLKRISGIQTGYFLIVSEQRFSITWTKNDFYYSCVLRKTNVASDFTNIDILLLWTNIKCKFLFWSINIFKRKRVGRYCKGGVGVSLVSFLIKWDKGFKNPQNKICGIQPLKHLKGYGLFRQKISLQFFKGCLPQILLSPFLILFPKWL